MIHNSAALMDEWMAKMSTAHHARAANKWALLSWDHGKHPSTPDSEHPVFVESFQAQEHIGWQAFLEGCIST